MEAMEQGAPEETGMPDGSAFCVEIHFNQDGTIKVGVEELSEAVEEESTGNYQTVPDIQAALKLVQSIYANGGKTQTPEKAGKSMQEGYQ